MRSDLLDLEKFKLQYEHSKIKEITGRNSSLKPEISVIILTYQHEKFIRDALRSVCEQNVQVPMELVICDDGSIDKTMEICQEYLADHEVTYKIFKNSRENNIKILEKPCGIMQFTHGLLNCKGRFIAILSGDDCWTDITKLQKQYDYLVEHPSVSCVYTPWVDRYVNEDGQVNETFRQEFPKASTLMFRHHFKDVPSAMLSTLQEDEFILGVLREKGQIELLTNITPTIYRIHSTNIWAGSDRGFRLNSMFITYTALVEACEMTSSKVSYVGRALLTLAKGIVLRKPVQMKHIKRLVSIVRQQRLVIPLLKHCPYLLVSLIRKSFGKLRKTFKISGK